VGPRKQGEIDLAVLSLTVNAMPKLLEYRLLDGFQIDQPREEDLQGCENDQKSQQDKEKVQRNVPGAFHSEDLRKLG
jgi:hypothetical protein